MSVNTFGANSFTMLSDDRNNKNKDNAKVALGTSGRTFIENQLSALQAEEHWQKLVKAGEIPGLSKS